MYVFPYRARGEPLYQEVWRVTHHLGQLDKRLAENQCYSVISLFWALEERLPLEGPAS